MTTCPNHLPRPEELDDTAQEPVLEQCRRHDELLQKDAGSNNGSYPLTTQPKGADDPTTSIRNAAEALVSTFSARVNYLLISPQATALESKQQVICIDEKPAISVNQGIWNPRSFRQLATMGEYSDEFVNSVPLLDPVERAGAYLFMSAMYKNIAARRYHCLERWIKTADPEKTRIWVFGICESDHWTAVKIDWTSRTIYTYDPMGNGMSTRARRNSKVRSLNHPAAQLG